MATVTDVEVANASFPNVRQDLNDILEALATNFSADAEPTTTYPNQFWYETDTNLLYIRNEANDAWVTLASINQTSGEWEPRTAVIQAVDNGGVQIKTNEGTARITVADNGNVTIANDLTVSGDLTVTGSLDKISEGNSSVEVVDTGTGHVAVTVDGSETARFDANGRLGIGDNNPRAKVSFGTTAVDTNGYDVTGFRLYDNGSTIFYGFGVSDTQLNYRTGTANDQHVWYAASTEVMRIDGSDNLKFNSGFGSVATAYGCRAWVNFDGTTNTGGNCDIRASGNVSTVADNGVGQYEVNFQTAMPDANYTIATNGGGPNVSSGTVTKGVSLAINGDAASPFLEAPSTTSFHIIGTDDTSNYSDNLDCGWVNIAVFR